MALPKAILRAVTSKTTRANLIGDEKWVLALECGHVAEAMKRKRGRNIDRTAPARVACVQCNTQRAAKP